MYRDKPAGAFAYDEHLTVSFEFRYPLCPVSFGAYSAALRKALVEKGMQDDVVSSTEESSTAAGAALGASTTSSSSRSTTSSSSSGSTPTTLRWTPAIGRVAQAVCLDLVQEALERKDAGQEPGWQEFAVPLVLTNPSAEATAALGENERHFSMRFVGSVQGWDEAEAGDPVECKGYGLEKTDCTFSEWVGWGCSARCGGGVELFTRKPVLQTGIIVKLLLALA